ncbi:MAG: T9SS type A sorting domain-containing protein [Candidatus Komeilibacteria bacterium]
MKRLFLILSVHYGLLISQNWQPVYELYNSNIYDHFYTMNTVEANQAISSMNYVNNGICYYWSCVNFGGAAAIYRLWHNSDHFYTTSTVERDNCVNSGYINEGIVGYLSISSTNGLTGWHRLYHDGLDDHAYPAEQNDINSLLSQGYYSEGVQGYISLTGIVNNDNNNNDDDQSDNDDDNGNDDYQISNPPDAQWSIALQSEYNYQEISFAWQATDDQTPVSDLWYHIQLTGEGAFDFWSMDEELLCWPGLGSHTLTITARDYDNNVDLTPLVHQFATIVNEPQEPTNLGCMVSENSIILSWQCSDPYSVGFTIWRDYDNYLADLDSDQLTYLDANVEFNHDYRYVVVNYNDYGWIASNPVICSLAGEPEQEEEVEEYLDPLYQMADRFDYPVGYPDFSGWYDAQPFGSIAYLPGVFHSGSDLNKTDYNDLGAPVFAPANGLIVDMKTTTHDNWGKCLIIRSLAPPNEYFYFPDGTVGEEVHFMLAHLGDINILTPSGYLSEDRIVLGETIVQRGWEIGTIGDFGFPPHLHLECWQELDYDDPYPWGYAYYDPIPEQKCDAMEFIANNRFLDNYFAIYCHTYDQWVAEVTRFERLTDNWNQITGYESFCYGDDCDPVLGYNNLLYVAEDNQAAIARWYLEIVDSGFYEVFVWISNYHYLGVGHYSVNTTHGSSSTIEVDGAGYANEWVSLGIFEFTVEDPNYIELNTFSNDPQGVEIAADAIKLEYRPYQTHRDSSLPKLVEMSSFPNPFNSNVSISFQLEKALLVDLIVYDLRGREVVVLMQDQMVEGEYQTVWNGMSDSGSAVPSGVYLVAVQSQNNIIGNKKVVYMK